MLDLSWYLSLLRKMNSIKAHLKSIMSPHHFKILENPILSFLQQISQENGNYIFAFLYFYMKILAFILSLSHIENYTKINHLFWRMIFSNPFVYLLPIFSRNTKQSKVEEGDKQQLLNTKNYDKYKYKTTIITSLRSLVI